MRKTRDITTTSNAEEPCFSGGEKKTHPPKTSLLFWMKIRREIRIQTHNMNNIIPADNYHEIKALNKLCKAGKLFDVQKWISDGKPINPRQPTKGNRRKPPLEISIDCGFHSLVQILLEAGAIIVNDRYNALEQAVNCKRLCIIMLLVEHGADVRSVDMFEVFETWDPKIMDFLIENGADVETDFQLAGAFCEKIRTDN